MGKSAVSAVQLLFLPFANEHRYKPLDIPFPGRSSCFAVVGNVVFIPKIFVGISKLSGGLCKFYSMADIFLFVDLFDSGGNTAFLKCQYASA